VYRPEAAKLCQDCHMPLEPAVQGDAGAKNGMVRSHRFLGANTALPHLRGDADQEQRTLDNLRGRASLALLWSGPARVDALMRARGVGHRFPGGTMDSNEVWLEVTAFDAAGKVVGVSGGRGRDGALDADTHLVRAQPVDEHGAPLAKRDPQHQRGMAFDAALTPSDPQVVRFEVPRGTARVRARLLYRKFTPAYAAFACADLPAPATRARCLDLPIAEIAVADVAAGAPPPDDPATLVDWGLALADATADHAEEARAPLEAARAKWPARVEPLLGLARLAYKLGQTDDVVRYGDEALARAPDHPAALALQTRALLDAYRFAAARPLAERLARRLPGDRIALALLARARGLTGDPAGALAAADGVLAIDPESEEGFYQRSLALGDLGRTDDARLAAARYETFRVSVETDLALRDRWRRLHPGHADEPEPCHTHRLVTR
jgi:tetratricopeptide (TPR) repeat protein